MKMTFIEWLKEIEFNTQLRLGGNTLKAEIFSPGFNAEKAAAALLDLAKAVFKL